MFDILKFIVVSFIKKKNLISANSRLFTQAELLLSFIVVLSIFLKYLRSVLFPKIVVSVLVGLVLYLCHDFSCLMTGSRF